MIPSIKIINWVLSKYDSIESLKFNSGHSLISLTVIKPYHSGRIAWKILGVFRMEKKR